MSTPICLHVFPMGRSTCIVCNCNGCKKMLRNCAVHIVSVYAAMRRKELMKVQPLLCVQAHSGLCCLCAEAFQSRAKLDMGEI